jgi:hypothetical protein
VVNHHHINPIKSYWIPPPNGINWTEATRVDNESFCENIEQKIEKHALLDCLLEEQVFFKPYKTNPFPYLTNDLTKVD